MFLFTLMHQSFVTPAHPTPHLRGWAGDSKANVQAMTFWVPPQYRVNAGLVILRKYIPVKFTLKKCRAMTHSRSPQCRAFSRALMDEKSLFPLFPVGGGGGQWLQMTGALSLIIIIGPGKNGGHSTPPCFRRMGILADASDQHGFTDLYSSTRHSFQRRSKRGAAAWQNQQNYLCAQQRLW